MLIQHIMAQSFIILFIEKTQIGDVIPAPVLPVHVSTGSLNIYTHFTNPEARILAYILPKSLLFHYINSPPFFSKTWVLFLDIS